MKPVILIILAVLTVRVHAQIVNVDRQFSPDSVFNNWSFTGNFSFSSDKQRNNVLDISSNLELARHFRNNYTVFTILRNETVFYGKKSIQDEGQFQIRLRDRDSRKFSIESYLQYQWNGAWGMEYRYVAGSNLRTKIFDKESSDMYLGTGVFGEWERWNWKGVKPEKVPPDATDITAHTFRLNAYAKYSRKVTEHIDISAVSYSQFPLDNRFLNPRWYMEAKVFVRASRHLSLVFHWDHIYDNRRLVPIDRFYYTVSTGIQLNF